MLCSVSYVNPMLPTIPSPTTNLSLGEVTARLAANPAVAGLLTIGSASRGEVTQVSDYDLIVVLSESPMPLRVGLTHVEGRLTDIIFVNVGEYARLLGEPDPIGNAQWADVQLLRWLRDGRVLYDRSGLLERARQLAESEAGIEPRADELCAAWFSINFNLQHTKRMLNSNDPEYQMAVDLRLLFSLHDLWRCYFIIRRIAAFGEKMQARYLIVHDPDYLHAFQACLTQTDRHAKYQDYVQLAARTIAPMGGLWPEGVTSILPAVIEQEDVESISRALSFWQSLVASHEA
jgi:predicted nucleotidyltransferase